MDFNDLRYIITIAEERTLSKAAEKLYIAQPSLSRTVMKLEKSLGVQLFDRTKTPLTVTYAGNLFIEKAKKMLDIQASLLKDIKDFSNLEKGRLILGVMQFEEKYYLPQVLFAFHKEYPGIEVEIINDTSAGLENLLLNDTVDLAITLLPVLNPNINFHFIMTSDILLALPRQHPLSQKYSPPADGSAEYPSIDINRIADLPFIILKPGRRMRDITLNVCQNAGFTPKIVLETESFDAANAFVVSGYGTTFILEPLIEHCAPPYRAAYFKIKDHDLTQTVVVAYKKNKPLTAAAEAFLGIAEEYRSLSL